MSTAKRTRGRQSEVGAAPSLPPAKKAKTSQDAHSSSLAFLADENQRAGKKLQANLTNGVKDARANRIDETKTVVANQATTPHEIIDISSGEESSEYEGSEDGDDEEQEIAEVPKTLTNGIAAHDDVDAVRGAEDAVMADADDDEEEAAGPSFGDLLHASHPDTIDVQAAFTDEHDADAQALVSTDADRILTGPSATSLGTVLAQALRTNDKDLLESCLQLQDPSSIRSTIQRLQSPLVGSLLQRLAERVHKRPGRAGNLLIWIQWSLVAHGGYLAGQPEVLRKLKALSQVVRERANGLNNLMVLKGKLDMLAAQIELRREVRLAHGPQYDSDEEDPAVIYVEGQDDDRSELGSDGEYHQKRRRPRPRGGRGRNKNKLNGLDIAEEDSDDEDVDTLALTNGVADHDDDSDEGEDEEAEGMFDDEAEETSDEEGEELSEDDDDEDETEQEEADETSASEAGSPPPVNPPKPQQRVRKR